MVRRLRRWPASIPRPCQHPTSPWMSLKAQATQGYCSMWLTRRANQQRQSDRDGAHTYHGFPPRVKLWSVILRPQIECLGRCPGWTKHRGPVRVRLGSILLRPEIDSFREAGWTNHRGPPRVRAPGSIILRPEIDGCWEALGHDREKDRVIPRHGASADNGTGGSSSGPRKIELIETSGSSDPADVDALDPPSNGVTWRLGREEDRTHLWKSTIGSNSIRLVNRCG